MNGTDFLDANVLVYAYDQGDARKRGIAQVLMREALLGHAVLSAQVLAEFSRVLLHKSRFRASPSAVAEILTELAPLLVIPQDAAMVRRAVDAHAAYGLHFWDAMIVAAAERAGCRRILSEDFNPGQRYFGIPVENPFAPDFS